MFTGIVEEVGSIGRAGTRMKVLCRTVLTDAFPGSSIAVNGTCLTAVQLDADGFWMDLSPETVAKTNLGDLAAGSLVNLERPLAIGDRLSGHLVQGHVDGTGRFLGMEALPEGNWWLRIEAPRELDRYLIQKGSICVDGISLTMAELRDGVVSIAVIPHTYEHTALRGKQAGSRVNIEVDMIAKYVEKLVAAFPLQ